MIAFLGALAGWLLYAALVMALGSLAGRHLLVPRAASRIAGAEERLTDAAARLGYAAALVLPAAMAMVFLRQLQEFRDPYAPWGEEAHLLVAGTQWGRTWMLAAGLAGLASVAFWRARARGGPNWWIATAAIVVLSLYPALSGHASGTEGLRPLTITADFLHVLAAGAWVGGLAFVLLAERSWRAGEGEPTSVLPALVPIFSPLAIASVATLVVTGTVAAWIHVGSLGMLFGSAYGRLLVAKLVVVFGVLYLGAVNWRRLTPQLHGELGQAALRRSATLELVAGQVVLAITAVLTRTPPMGP